MKWFTSDTHWFHERILLWAKKRHKWSSIHEMNEGLIKMWNDVVKEDDDVFNLGDLSFQVNRKFDEINSILRRLNGNHHLIFGNHDRHKNIYLFENIKTKQDNIFLTLKDDIGEVEFFLAHYPYKHAMKEKDLLERPDSYVQYRRKEGGEIIPLLNGHVHDAWMIRKDCLNLGFDAHGKMVSEKEIMAIYRDTNGFQENLEKYDNI